MKMSRSQKDFVAMVELGEGKVSSKKISWNQKFHEFWNFFSGDHEYKFFVDGQWVTDPNAPTVENNAGFKASVERFDFT